MPDYRRVPLLSRRHFLIRILQRTIVVAGIILASLGMGAVGYHWTEGWPWIDSVLNASMILTGMGPVNVVKSDAGKIFATLYALFSGVVFLTAMALLLAPVMHRFLHRFHLEHFAGDGDNKETDQ